MTATVRALAKDLRELLKNITPGPYGFQAYGRRERLVTAAVGDGRGEPIAIFNRAEDARGFAAAVRNLPTLLDALEQPEQLGQQAAAPDVASKALEGLFALAYAADRAFEDGGEQLADGSHLIDEKHGAELSNALDILDALPDDQPEYTMGPAAKARWALRDFFNQQAAAPPVEQMREGLTKILATCENARRLNIQSPWADAIEGFARAALAVAPPRADLIGQMRTLLSGFLYCPEIADCAPEDKDPETDALERDTRRLLDAVAPPPVGSITDEMVNIGADVLLKRQVGGTPTLDNIAGWARDQYREHVRAILEAALSTPPVRGGSRVLWPTSR